jgi:low temperature requirement protein LtrA
MKFDIRSTAWWGAPKKYDTEHKERKISWLELFYDLVYVIAIAKITHHLSEHLNLPALLDYAYLFIMIFWGWLNGSMHHDLHASEGLRTRLMTLWQMLIIAALVVALNDNEGHGLRNVMIVIMVMQLYLTYLWWSVGIYDRDHRKRNRPFTIIYLLSLVLMALSIFIGQPYQRIILYDTLLLNYLPPILVASSSKGRTSGIRLSSSMTERLGLFTIILFGEVITGVVNGVSAVGALTLRIWLDFVLAVAIVFALWWIFFALVSDRKCKKGFINSTLLEILYLLPLIALGLMGMAFSGLFKHYDTTAFHFISLKMILGLTVCLFFSGINLMTLLLEYPPQYTRLKKSAQRIILSASVLVLIMTLLHLKIGLSAYLLIILGITLLVILLLNFNWYSIYSKDSLISAEE